MSVIVDIPPPARQAESSLLSRSRLSRHAWPICTDGQCEGAGKALVPKILYDDTRLWECLDCGHTQPRAKRVLPEQQLPRHLREAN